MPNKKQASKKPARKAMIRPVNMIFQYLQRRTRVQVWLYSNVSLRIEGHIVGFDVYMNMVMDDAEEYYTRTQIRKKLGRILLKGDNVTLIQPVQPQA